MSLPVDTEILTSLFRGLSATGGCTVASSVRGWRQRIGIWADWWHLEVGYQVIVQNFSFEHSIGFKNTIYGNV